MLTYEVSVRHVNGLGFSGLRNTIYAGKGTEMDALLKSFSNAQCVKFNLQTECNC